VTAIDLSGKTALVTGGGQGLGAATAEALAKAGARVAVNYFGDPQGVNRRRAEETAAAIGPSAAAVEADVRSPAALAAMFDAIAARFGGIDIVVNNAAILRDHSVKKMSPEDWQQVIDTNLTGVFNVSKLAAERLADGGRIVNLSSISAFEGFFGQANYAAAKAGVAAMTRVLARELARRRITVNAVAPGVVLTEMGRSIPEAVRAEMITSIPLGRFGEPQEIAGVILFLASDLASYVTGQVIHVSGGWWV
jgi:3-oxoacyl-[acyl-carrier protein] reductase